MFVETLLHKSLRGVELAQVYWVSVLDEPLAGEFYDVRELPEDLVDSQRDFIARAAEDFLTQYDEPT
jgi:hypothetical protein